MGFFRVERETKVNKTEVERMTQGALENLDKKISEQKLSFKCGT